MADYQVTHYENALNIAAPAFLNKNQESYEHTIRVLLDIIKFLEGTEPDG